MRNFENITPMELGQAHKFATESALQLGKVVVGEPDAIEAVQLILATGGNGMLFGAPGGAKSKLASVSHRLIEGIEEDDVASVPAQADMQPREVVGGEARTRKIDTNEDGETHTQESVMQIDAFIKPHTKVVVVDEANRIGTAAMNTLLVAFEERIIHNNTGVHDVDIRYGIGTMNPAGNRYNTYDMDPAFASRHMVGVELGDRTGMDAAARHQQGRDIQKHRFIKDKTVRPVINLKDLDSLQALVNGTDHAMIDLPDNMLDELVTRVDRTQDILYEDHDIYESDGRMIVQTDILSRAVAALRGEATVTEAHIKRALRFVIGGRIGILGTKGKKPVSAVKITEDVYNNA